MTLWKIDWQVDQLGNEISKWIEAKFLNDKMYDVAVYDKNCEYRHKMWKIWNSELEGMKVWKQNIKYDINILFNLV